MDDALLVGRVERVDNLPRDASASSTGRALTSRSASVGPSISSSTERRHLAGLFEAVDRPDMGMIERGERACLTSESRPVLRVRHVTPSAVS